MNYKELNKLNKEEESILQTFKVKNGYIYFTDTNISRVEKTILPDGLYEFKNNDLIKSDLPVECFPSLDDNMSAYKNNGKVKFKKTFIKSTLEMDMSNERSYGLYSCLYFVDDIAYSTDGNIFSICSIGYDENRNFAINKNFLKWVKIHKEWGIEWSIYENEINIIFMVDDVKYILKKDIKGIEKFKNALGVIKKLLDGSIETLGKRGEK